MGSAPRDPRHPGDPSVWHGGASPLVMVIAVSLGVVLTPYVHHHVALGQALGVPGAHHLCVLPGGGVRLLSPGRSPGETGDPRELPLVRPGTPGRDRELRGDSQVGLRTRRVVPRCDYGPQREIRDLRVAPGWDQESPSGDGEPKGGPQVRPGTPRGAPKGTGDPEGGLVIKRWPRGRTRGRAGAGAPRGVPAPWKGSREVVGPGARGPE